MVKTTPVTVIIPVYGDWRSLSTCIDSLITNIGNTNNFALFVNDCGPDADEIEKNILSKIDGQKNFRYERNPKNLGFVGTCNRAVLNLDKTNNDILLLNSDAALTKGALEEMAYLLASNKQIGSISPRSNNATICTIPINAINEKGVSRLFSKILFDKYHKQYRRYEETPTAHGFCMLIRRSTIDKIGLFDPVFGRGYGEEVDFCQRLHKEGWQTGIANWAFVYHLEARSFSIKTKQELLENNGKIISERYPEYRPNVRHKIEEMKKQERELFSHLDMNLINISRTITKLRKSLKK